MVVSKAYAEYRVRKYDSEGKQHIVLLEEKNMSLGL